MSPRISLEQPGKYKVLVQGKLSDQWADCFEGMTITTGIFPDGTEFTMLEGTLEDQAAVQGTLHKLYTLGFVLISVQKLEQSDCQDIPP